MPPTASPEPDRALTQDGAVLPAAVLWDMDGTLVDTEPSWLAAEEELVHEFGGTWTEQDSLAMIGMSLMPAAQILADHGVDLPLEVIGQRLVASVIASVGRSLVWQPGARELLTAAHEAGVPCALVTMSYRAFAEAVVSQGPSDVFQVIVTGDEVEHGKPHPEPYLKAARELGVDIADCVAVEDSRPGIASAMASGARTLGVQHIVPVEARPGLSRVGSLAQVDLDDLARIVAGEVIDRL